ncbi:Cytosine-specific methyltransferase NlaX [Neisseria zoodegmatis]|uniref:DNA (cytosine-5-)-methyltransferase n=1 Tax=Neisseria zoodegmatis TaxID=326523 RepID=A0A378WIJ2_9NEIS|nr:DNA (cytosine-5-)-methyltransferase [Neisseria zoodegmatis]SUA36364.1 Cytosine-specific methyltransferase NlaX [Neisseria zoodegmatis]
MDAGKTFIRPEARPKPTVGSLFAGIGGFDLGFERGGFQTAWQVEIDPVCRAVLADRFPHAERHEDVRTCLPALSRVDAVVGGFPCQDVSAMGKRRGLAGTRSGLFFDAMRIVQTLQPRWLVLENVPGLLFSNGGRDFQTVLETLAECGYVGYWRVLDSRYFGVPTKRRRIFMVAGLRELPPVEFLGDAGPMARVSGKTEAGSAWEDAHPTLLAGFADGTSIDISGGNIVAVENSRHQMVERARTSDHYGLRRGLDAANAREARAAGNAVCPQVAQWIAEKLIKTF